MLTYSPYSIGGSRLILVLYLHSTLLFFQTITNPSANTCGTLLNTLIECTSDKKKL